MISTCKGEGKKKSKEERAAGLTSKGGTEYAERAHQLRCGKLERD